MATTFNIRPLATPPTYPLNQVPTFDMGTVINAVNVSTTQTSPNLSVVNFKGITVILNVTTFGGSVLNVNINGVDPTSNNTFSLLVGGGTGITAAATTAFTVYPGINQPGSIPNNASYQVSTILPTIVQISVTGTITGASFTVSALLTT